MQNSLFRTSDLLREKLTYQHMYVCMDHAQIPPNMCMRRSLKVLWPAKQIVKYRREKNSILTQIPPERLCALYPPTRQTTTTRLSTATSTTAPSLTHCSSLPFVLFHVATALNFAFPFFSVSVWVHRSIDFRTAKKYMRSNRPVLNSHARAFSHHKMGVVRRYQPYIQSRRLHDYTVYSVSCICRAVVCVPRM
jgi:hypothetical protein